MPPIVADAELLKIVFVNLLVNGAHAMQGRGTIRVSLASIGDTCQIAIGDSGPGIPVEIREKIFTPFFTTKARGSRAGPCDRQAPRRSPPRQHQRRLSARRREPPSPSSFPHRVRWPAERPFPHGPVLEETNGRCPPDREFCFMIPGPSA